MSLLAEVMKLLAENGKSIKDVFWVGNRAGTCGCTWREFARMASAVSCDEEHLVPTEDLVIVGDHWWIECRADPQHEDCQDAWFFCEMPKLQQMSRDILRIKRPVGWSACSIERLNE